MPTTRSRACSHWLVDVSQSGGGWRRGPGDQMTYQAMLSNEQYPWLEPLLPPPSNHLKIPHRQVLDAWLYVCYRGCA